MVDLCHVTQIRLGRVTWQPYHIILYTYNIIRYAARFFIEPHVKSYHVRRTRPEKPIQPINQSKSPKLIDFNTMEWFSITSSYKQSAIVTTFKKDFSQIRVDFWSEIKSPFWWSFRGFSLIFDERAFNLCYRMIHFLVLKAKPEILIELSCPVGMKLRSRLGFKGLDCFESSRCPIKISEKTDYCSPNVQPSTQH